MMIRLSPGLRRRGERLGAAAGRVAKEAFDTAARTATTRTIRLAVTGLSRSGKTVLTTQLVHNLLLAVRDRSRLPFLEAVADGILKDARIEPIADTVVFPYEESVATMSRPAPEWPTPTRNLSGLRVVLRHRPRNPVVARLAPLGTLNIEIVDYPGEWLLDLPLLRQSYHEWSAAALERCEAGSRARLAAPWLETMKTLEVDERVDDPAELAARVQAAGRRYREFLLACRETPPGLKLLQPGRFLAGFEALPEPDSFLFCPVPRPAFAPGTVFPRRLMRSLGRLSGQREEWVPTLRHEMERRFERYKSEIVLPFYRDYFLRYDRQIVLVDVLTSLSVSHEAFEDARAALLAVMESFRFGSDSILRRIIPARFGARIGRVLFAATKADHVTHNQYANLERLLQAMVAGRADEIIGEGANVGFQVVAAVKSTENILIEFQGRPLSVLRGALKSAPSQQLKHYPGQIPARLPVAADWEQGLFDFAEFAPRRLPTAGGEIMPHIHLDKVLEFLIGGRLG